MGKFVNDIIKLNRPDKCIGFLPTCFAGMAGKPQPYPTFDEYICHTWAGIIRGGKTLDPYAYHDMNDRASMYEGTRYIFTTFKALDKLILLANRTVLVKNQEVEAVLYELDGEKMFVAVIGEYVVAAFGLNDFMNTFEAKLTAAYPTVEYAYNAAITE
jgi:hypothetical protein